MVRSNHTGIHRLTVTLQYMQMDGFRHTTKTKEHDMRIMPIFDFALAVL